MNNGKISIAVKVGSESDIRFNSDTVTSYRAITFKELAIITKNKADISMVVIENIKDDEYDKAKEFIEEFKSLNDSNKVFFYIKDNDDTTCGIADELMYDIHLNISSLHRVINSIYGINVSTEILTQDTSDNSVESAYDIGFDNSFGIESTVTVAKEEVYESKATDLVSGVDLGIKEEESLIEKIIESAKLDTINKEVENVVESVKVGVEKDIEPVEIEVTEEEPVVLHGMDKIEDIPVIIKDTDNSKLEGVITALEEDKSQLKRELSEAVEKTIQLTDVLSALEDEVGNYKSILDSLYKSDNIIEDPIGLAEYQSIKEELELLKAEKDSLSVKLESDNISTEELDNANKTIAELNIRLTEATSVIEELDTANKNIDELNIKLTEATSVIEELKTEKNSLSVKLESDSLNSEELDNANKTIAELNIKLTEATSLIEGLKEEITKFTDEADVFKEDIIQLRSDIIEYSNRVNFESKGRLKVTELLTKSIKESSILSKELLEKNREIERITASIDELGSQNTEREQRIIKLTEEIEEINKSKEEYSKKIEDLNLEIEGYKTTIESLNAELIGLRVRVADVDQVIANSASGYEADIAKLNNEKIGLQSKLDLISSQLAAKDYQYNSLIQTCGVDANGASAVLENNKTLELINTSLKEQIHKLKGDVVQLTRETAQHAQRAQSLDVANKQLKSSLNAVTYGMSTGNSVKIPPCNYTGKGLIIPVFGSGSFGITTTAMSLATKFASDSSVLYIDFDMIMPKADMWFNTNPMISGIPSENGQDIKGTGLQLFLDTNIQFFSKYASSIIKTISIDKKKSIDYLSGLYARQDIVKLISADFSYFFNYCGNKYNYVIVDFGRLGCSEVNDMVIKMVTDIAYKSVVVTNNNKFEVRTFTMKIDDAKIDKYNISWLLNMSENTSVDDQTKRFMGPAKYGIMPYSEDIHGKMVNLLKNKLTRDKLDLFINTALVK